MVTMTLKVIGVMWLSQVVLLKGEKSNYNIVSKSRACYVPTLENGNVHTKEITRESFKGTLSCDPGFKLFGTAKIQCLGGKWTVKNRDFPFCAAITSCSDEMPTKLHGKWTPVQGYGNSVYRFKCSPGYQMLGPRTVFCSANGWSSGSGKLPFCTRGGCNNTQLLGPGVEHGGARQIMGGAVYRFYCSYKAVMEGSSTVFCDGDRWSAAKPLCLVAPTPPVVTILTNGIGGKFARKHVIAGQDIVIECNATGGDPNTNVTIIVNEHKVGETNIAVTKHTVTIEEEHPSLTVFCKAENKVSTSDSDHHFLPLFYSSPVIEIEGEETVVRGAAAEYSCMMGESYPQPDVTVHVTDDNGDTIETLNHVVEYQERNKGFLTTVHFSVIVPDSASKAYIHCKGTNPAGEANISVNVAVLFATSHVHIAGNTSMLPGNLAHYSCSSGESNPRAQLAWTVKDEDGKDVPYTNKDIPEDDAKLSNITLQALESHDRIHITCLSSNQVGQASHTLLVIVNKPPANLELSCPSSAKAGHLTKCDCVLPSTSQAEVTWSVSDVHGEVINAERDDYDDGEMHRSSIRYQALARNHEVTIKCRATNTLGSVYQQHHTVIQYKPSKLVLNVPKTVNQDEQVSLHCSTDTAYPAPTLYWLINGVIQEEGLENSKIVVEKKGIISHSAINFTSVGDEEKLDVTCCVDGIDLCQSKTAHVIVKPRLVQLLATKNKNIEKQIADYRWETNSGESYKNYDTNNPEYIDEYPDTTQFNNLVQLNATENKNFEKQIASDRWETNSGESDKKYDANNTEYIDEYPDTTQFNNIVQLHATENKNVEKQISSDRWETNSGESDKKHDANNPEDIDEYSDNTQFNKLEFSAKYLNENIDMENTPVNLKLVSSDAKSLSNTFGIIFLMMFLTFNNQ